MLTFEEIIKKTRKVGKTVADKASDVYDYTKLSVQSASISGQLEEEYAALGKLVYLEKVKGKDTAAEQEKKIEDIGVLILTQKEKQAAKAEIKNEKQCPTCGRTIRQSDAFCAECGTKL